MQASTQPRSSTPKLRPYGSPALPLNRIPSLDQIERQFEGFLQSMKQHVSSAIANRPPATPAMIVDGQAATSEIPPPTWESEREAEWLPHLDILEDATHVLVIIDLPGVPSTSLHVELRNIENVLVIEGSRSDFDLGDYQLAEDKRCWIRERATGYFKRIIVLPTSVDTDREPDAYAQNGMLIVRIFKKTSNVSSSKKVPVKHL